ncbi:sunset domain-containing protein [Saccharopolyspora mangrovi]|uniref:Uncharacterized protein n=1 Tax=Saccharopolyspora mangrovi TaxID=3082379 RepID=A0ABU6AB88_9PSEU|nr:hypothetical protein [Saccharopolyspora sp. S2-29]MEB3368669.1 hypothetical protein [Saccharopolyspora sp. S2-29]
MITWLFTQVWLWSLAAFLLGAFVTWALFVRPLRRSLKAELARPRYAEPVHVYDEPVYEEYEDTAYADEPVEHQQAPLDLLEQPRQWEAPEEQQLDEWDRKPRPWVAPEAVRSAPADTQRLPEPEPEPVPEPEPAGDNTWFRNPEIEETRAEPRPSQFPRGADEEDSGQLSGQLRSLFEPESADTQEPYTPPVGADATQVIPAVPPEQDNPADIKLVDNPDESAPLPRRTPGAGPHPGRDTKWEPPSEQPPEAPQAAPAPAKPSPTGSSGPMIKGHSASRQYHTPDSPQYDQITADVWFRTPADAEIAGFESWRSTSRGS